MEDEATKDRDGRTPGEVVRAYVTKRREWEISTMERATGWKRGELLDPDRFVAAPDQSALEEAWSDLRRLREEWCTPAAVGRLDPHASFGTSSEFDPDDLVVLTVDRVSDQEVKLRTREYPFAADDLKIATEYDYVLCLVDGAWRLDQRSTLGLGADVISDLL